MKICLVTPPFTQINTPYPAIQQLGGFLKSKGYEPELTDLSQKVIKRIFSKEFLKVLFNKHKCLNKEFYLEFIEPVASFLSGKDNNLAHLIISEPAFYNLANEQELDFDYQYFPNITDKAKFLATKFIEVIYLFINEHENKNFGLSRYGEKLAASCPDFSVIEKELNQRNNLIDILIEEETERHILKNHPSVVGYSIPFPGNLLGSLISARRVKEIIPETKIVFGGGYINTELRKISDKKFFNYVDYLTIDDGEIPLLRIIENLKTNEKHFCRTFTLVNDEIKFLNNNNETLLHNQLPAPQVEGFKPTDYFSVIEINNRMHRLWSDGFWNKLTLAHGCYWNKCTFCDTSLDYIGRYSPAKASKLVDDIEKMISQNGVRSFHFTDEAAPPKLLKELAVELIRREVKILWWGNIRFEKSFDENLCKLLRKSGCIAVSGGIEVADKRLLKMINKGVSIEDAALVCKNFRDAGIMVHAYLMYGFPTETEQETINSLELVRQFFINGLFTSAYWHRFSLTVHSPIYFNREKYNIKVVSGDKNSFGNNDLKYIEKNGIDHGKYSFGLKKALYNYLHNNCLDWDVREWFDFQVPDSTIKRNYISTLIENSKPCSKKYTFYLKNFSTAEFFRKGKIGKIILRNDLLEGEWDLKLETANKLFSFLNNEEKFLDVNLINRDANLLNSGEWKEISENFLIGIGN